MPFPSSALRPGLTVALLAFGVACHLAAAPANPEAATVWQRWETSLTSQRDHANPYRDVTLRVDFAGPGGRHFAGYGFWDGGKTFRLRAAFPAPGEWTWQTTCSDPGDPGLHTRRGKVAVGSYAGSNPLLRHGFLQVSANRRHLVHADGTPFLWIGDTPWSAFIAASQEEWERYLDNRRENKFTLVQVHCGSGFLRLDRDRAGEAPFQGTGAALQWNPAYWQGVERKVRAANDRGLVVYVCAVRQPGAGMPMKGFPGDDEAEVARFARSLAARLMGDCVVYSPMADDVWTPAADAAGRALREATSQHLLSAHPRFLLEPAIAAHGRDWVDIVGFQSGEGWMHDPYKKLPKQPFSTALAAQNAWEWPLLLYGRSPAKPLINQEVPYDHPIEADGRLPLPPHKAGYWSFLSGAPGLTYGCFGIWNWGTPIRWMPTYDFPAALTLPSVTHLKHLAEFFAGLPWWTLEPRPELVPFPATDPLRRIAVAASPVGDLVVAYLPDNDSVTLALSVASATLPVRWFNPLTAETVAASAPAPVQGWSTYARPAGWEDALLVLARAP